MINVGYWTLAIILVIGVLIKVYGAYSLSIYPGWMISSSLTTFMLYGLDKFSAKLRGPRVPEKLLHTLSLAGGFWGGWAGMLLFHHKTNAEHDLFRDILGLSTLLHLSLMLLMKIVH